jgi:hypothetical protein
MSIEQLLVFLILVGLPLIRALRAALEKRRQTSPELPRDARDARDAPDAPDAPDELASYWPPAPEPPAPEPPAPEPPAPRPPVAVPTVYTSIAPPPPREEPDRPPPPPRHASFRRRAAWVPRDQESLRRAVVLMTVFGPPRALDR